MNVFKKLNSEILNQEFPYLEAGSDDIGTYRKVASSYVLLENSVAVLSDMRCGRSYIYYGKFADTLGLKHNSGEESLDSIWEKEILDRVHPDDLHGKYLHELKFLHFVKGQSRKRRKDFYLADNLRMKDTTGRYRNVLHRMFYIHYPGQNSIWLSLCLYNPSVSIHFTGGVIVDSLTGNERPLKSGNEVGILSDRERQVLWMIDRGQQSKEIAQNLSISIHTVSRHRQEILRKLNVRNSIAACRLAKELNIITEADSMA